MDKAQNNYSSFLCLLDEQKRSHVTQLNCHFCLFNLFNLLDCDVHFDQVYKKKVDANIDNISY
jgi:hypothetical protein